MPDEQNAEHEAPEYVARAEGDTDQAGPVAVAPENVKTGAEETDTEEEGEVLEPADPRWKPPLTEE